MARHLTLKKKLLFCFITLCLIGGFSLLLGEIVIRIVAPQDLNGTFRVADAHGLQIHRAGIRTKHQKGERVVYYEFREDGLRDYGATPGEQQILVLGDSFTFGWLLDGKDSYLGLLQKKVEDTFGPGKLELLNGGHGGWGASDYIRFYEEYGDSFDVSAVIVFFHNFDMERSVNRGQYGMNAEMTELHKRHGVRKDSRLKKLLNATPGYNWMCQNCHLFQALRRALIPAPPQSKVFDQEKDPALEKKENTIDPRIEPYMRLLYSRLKQLTEERGHKLLVLTTGYHWTRELEGKVTKRTIHVARRVFDELDIELHDISPQHQATTLASGKTIGIPGDGHPNELGATLIADLNWPHVKQFAEELLEN